MTSRMSGPTSGGPIHDQDATGQLVSDLGWALRRLSMSFQSQGGTAVAHLPQGARGYLVLVATAHGDAPTQLDLVHWLGIDKTSMTRLIDAMEDDHLVVRGPDRSDRRVRRIEITSAGLDALDRARKQLGEIESGLLASLSPAEQDLFRGMLTRVARSAGSFGEKGSDAEQ